MGPGRAEPRRPWCRFGVLFIDLFLCFGVMGTMWREWQDLNAEWLLRLARGRQGGAEAVVEALGSWIGRASDCWVDPGGWRGHWAWWPALPCLPYPVLLQGLLFSGGSMCAV